MGYTTTFDVGFGIVPPLAKTDLEFLKKFNETRRMKRVGMAPEFGVDGEFYVGGDEHLNCTDGNEPPSTQPGLWCQWVPTDDGCYLRWDEGEKFYEYVPWLVYLIAKVLKPRGYIVNGECTWEGEESDDRGKIVVKDNMVYTRQGYVDYGDLQEV